MKYSEIYDLKFLEKFGEYKEAIGNLELCLDTSLTIDLEKIADICEIDVEYVFSHHSGYSKKNETEKTVAINILDSEVRQRFTLAHEIGHIMLDHGGLTFRSSIEEYKDTIDRMNEVEANNFAANLIMPKRLVDEALLASVRDLDYTSTNDVEVETVIKLASKKLAVSQQALTYRISNLK